MCLDTRIAPQSACCSVAPNDILASPRDLASAPAQNRTVDEGLPLLASVVGGMVVGYLGALACLISGSAFLTAFLALVLLGAGTTAGLSVFASFRPSGVNARSGTDRAFVARDGEHDVKLA